MLQHSESSDYPYGALTGIPVTTVDEQGSSWIIIKGSPYTKYVGGEDYTVTEFYDLWCNVNPLRMDSVNEWGIRWAEYRDNDGKVVKSATKSDIDGVVEYHNEPDDVCSVTVTQKGNRVTKWLGETTCNICHTEIEDVLYDAKTRLGPWGTLCQRCFSDVGYGLGTGLGQKYQLVNGEYIKVEG